MIRAGILMTFSGRFVFRIKNGFIAVYMFLLQATLLIRLKVP